MLSSATQGSVLSQSSMVELRRRLTFLALAILVFRIGAHIPVPGLDPLRLADFFARQQGTIVGFFNMFSGGALKRLSIFALGVMPYISASIIVQLFSSVSPHLEQLKKEGESGRRKINQYTRYGTVILALFQGLGMVKILAAQHIAMSPDFTFFFTATVTLVTGTMFLMWLGEQITERGIGNGISMIIFAGIVSGLPAAMGRTFEQVKQGQMQAITLLAIAALVLGVTLFVVFMERAIRKITVNYAQRQQGRRMYAAHSNHLPLKINMSGVIPPIFASSILLFPGTIAKWFATEGHLDWLNDVALALSPGQPVHMMALAACILFFSFFYAALVFNPRETADNLKRSGAFVPGIRPGEQTANYIDNVMTRLTLIGGLYLALVALLPEVMRVAWNVPFYFGGTSLLIIVVVVMDFIAQVQSLQQSQQYASLLKKANPKAKSGKRRR